MEAALRLSGTFLYLGIFISPVSAIKRVEEIKAKRQAQFIKNRCGYYIVQLPMR